VFAINFTMFYYCKK